jgi:hypothetical protein
VGGRGGRERFCDEGTGGKSFLNNIGFRLVKLVGTLVADMRK